MPIGDTASELRGIARAATDASGYFPAMYSCVTDRIGETIGQGGFEQGARMDTFACTFASCYTAVAPGGAEATVLAGVVGRRRRPGLLIVQHLLLGINAHVNHDLPIAVVAVADTCGDLGSVRHDFDAVNDVLADTLGDVVGRLDRVSRWTNSHSARWGAGLQLLAGSSPAGGVGGGRAALPPQRRRHACTSRLDRLVTVLAYLIAHPALPWRPLLGRRARMEEHDARRVTAVLLGDG